MKSFRMIRPGGHAKIIVELSLKDMLRLLFGRELHLSKDIILRQHQAYDVFNLTAPASK